MKPNILFIVVGFLLMSAGPALAWEPWSYIAEPIDGRVLDKETGQPIEGTVVVAQWILAKPLEGQQTDFWIVTETLTNAEGKYRIPGWGPKTRPWFRWFVDLDPALIVFKPGYWPKSYGNGDPYMQTGTNLRGAKIRKSYWNGKDIRLVPFRLGQKIEQREIEESAFTSEGDKAKQIIMTEKVWADQLSDLQLAVNWLIGSFEWNENDWMRIKNLVGAINQECIRLSPQLQSNLYRIPEKYRAFIMGDVAPCL